MKPPVGVEAGPCSCDEPDEMGSVQAVRQFARDLGQCTQCGKNGLQLLGVGAERLHLRCFVVRYGMSALEQHPQAERVRMCCLPMKLLQWLIAPKRGIPHLLYMESGRTRRACKVPQKCFIPGVTMHVPPGRVIACPDCRAAVLRWVDTAKLVGRVINRMSRR